jgi:hypothetical protein
MKKHTRKNKPRPFSKKQKRSSRSLMLKRKFWKPKAARFIDFGRPVLGDPR